MNPLWDDIAIDIDEDTFFKKWDIESKKSIVQSYINITGMLSTPLTRAVYLGWIKVVGWLIKNGADINMKDKCGDTPLSDCLRHDNIQVLRLLLDNGADIKAHNCLFVNRLLLHNIDMIRSVISLNSCHIDPIIDRALLCGLVLNRPKLIRLLHVEKIRIVTTIFIDLPQYIILWITDWLPTSGYLKEYEKVGFIERVKSSIQKVIDKKD